MTKIGKFILSIFAIVCFGLMAKASDVSMKVEMYPEQVGVGDQARIILTLSSESDFENEDPDFPPAEGVRVLQATNSGRSSSSRMNIVNGKTEFSKTVSQHYEFLIQLTKKGIVQIPSISVSIDGKINASAPFRVSVSDKPQQDQNQPNRPKRDDTRSKTPDPFGDENEDDLFSQLMKQRQQMLEEIQRRYGAPGGSLGGRGSSDPLAVPELKLDVNTNEAFFVYADIDKKEAYEGEQITVNWYIYVKGNIESLDRAKFPDLKGFWKEIIEEVPGLNFSEALVNGIRYQRALLASHALFPIKAGTAVIDEFKIKARVRNLTQFGWGQPHEFTKASKRIPIKVLPLPQEGRTISFSGAVGQFQIQTQVAGTEIKAGQPFMVKVTFEGAGNAKLIELPPIEWPEGLSVFDVKSNSKYFKNGQSFKEFEILLVRSKEGEFKLPVIHFTYFDPAQKKYITKSTEEIPMKASKADGLPSALANDKGSALQTNESQKAAVILPIMEWPQFSWIKYRNLIYLIIFGGGSLILMGHFLFVYSRLGYQPTLQDKIDQKWKKIDLAMKNGNYKEVGSESVNLIYLLLDFAGDNGVSNEDILLRINNLPIYYKEKYRQTLVSLFDYFQTVGYAPEQLRKQALQEKTISDGLKELQKLSKEIVADQKR